MDVNENRYNPWSHGPMAMVGSTPHRWEKTRGCDRMFFDTEQSWISRKGKRKDTYSISSRESQRQRLECVRLTAELPYDNMLIELSPHHLWQLIPELSHDSPPAELEVLRTPATPIAELCAPPSDGSEKDYFTSGPRLRRRNAIRDNGEQATPGTPIAELFGDCDWTQVGTQQSEKPVLGIERSEKSTDILSPGSRDQRSEW